MFEMMRSIITDTEAGLARGTAHVPADVPFFADHFPGAPLLPGSFLIELAAQVAGPLAEETVCSRLGLERWAMLGIIRDAKFLRHTPLPAELLITAEVRGAVETSKVIVRVAARACEQEVLRAELWMMMLEAAPAWAEAIAARRERVARWKGAAP
jgi:3-hydroxymyristoyl/3-hydroxydecanoyl-(acyl carrier protein) dehydratase